MTSNTTILAPISVGELLDKITILQIKKQQAKPSQLTNIEKELAALTLLMPAVDNTLEELMQQLHDVNWSIWQAEDRIRTRAAQKQFDQRYIELATVIHQENDKRAVIKKQINTHTSSDIIEEKIY